MKVAQYEVLGMKQKEMSVPQGTIETFGSWSRTPAQRLSASVDRPVRDG
jgi:hypothetical protein